jgi:predicted negative regulator of RcsB-dependent stress response
VATQDLDEAVPHLNQALKGGDSAPLRELLARVLADQGRLDEALQQARAALAADPHRASARELVQRLESAAPDPGAAPR